MRCVAVRPFDLNRCKRDVLTPARNQGKNTGCLKMLRRPPSHHIARCLCFMTILPILASFLCQGPQVIFPQMDTRSIARIQSFTLHFTCMETHCLVKNCTHAIFYSVFVLDRSGSMQIEDNQPLPNTPTSAQISLQCNNRYGAVLSALYAFWSARETAALRNGSIRRDAYSIVLLGNNSSVSMALSMVSIPPYADRAICSRPIFRMIFQAPQINYCSHSYRSLSKQEPILPPLSMRPGM